MKIDEILRVRATQGVKPDTFDIKNAKEAGFMEGREVWVMDEPNGHEMYAFIENNIIISSIVGKMANYKGIKYFILVDTQTLPEYQKKGLATSLYMFLVERKKIRLLSDREQTSGGENLWDNLKKQFPDRVKVVDMETGKIEPFSRNNYNKIYIDGSTNSPLSDKYRLVLEDFEFNYECYSSADAYTIHKGYIKYTDPDKYGEFD